MSKLSNISIKLSLEKGISILGCIYLFISFNPYILWIIPSFAIYLPILMGLFLMTFVQWYNGNLIFTKKRFILSILFFLFASYMAVPVFWSEHHLFKILHFAPFFLFIIFLPNEVLYCIFLFFRSLIIFFSILSIVLFFLLFFNINIPHIIIDGFTIPMQYNNDFYRVYYLVVSSTNTIYDVGGFTIARACGPFAEPGHFGIFIGLVLAIEKLLWNKTSKLPIIAGFLTFSPAFYIILLFIITYDIIFKKNFKPFIVISSVLIIVFSLLLSDRDLREPIMFLAWNRNFAEGRSILDDRSRHYTINAYENFIKKPNIISGKGTHYVNNIGVLSDPRGMIFKFGLIGASITILILFIIFSMANRRTLFLLLPIVILIYFHRSWMFESPYIYLLVFLGISSLSLLEEFDDKDKKKQVYPKPV